MTDLHPEAAHLLRNWHAALGRGDSALAENLRIKLVQYGIDPIDVGGVGVDAVPPLEAAVPPKMETAVPERPRPPRQAWVKKPEASNE